MALLSSVVVRPLAAASNVHVDHGQGADALRPQGGALAHAVKDDVLSREGEQGPSGAKGAGPAPAVVPGQAGQGNAMARKPRPRLHAPAPRCEKSNAPSP